MELSKRVTILKLDESVNSDSTIITTNDGCVFVSTTVGTWGAKPGDAELIQIPVITTQLTTWVEDGAENSYALGSSGIFYRTANTTEFVAIPATGTYKRLVNIELGKVVAFTDTTATALLLQNGIGTEITLPSVGEWASDGYYHKQYVSCKGTSSNILYWENNAFTTLTSDSGSYGIWQDLDNSKTLAFGDNNGPVELLNGNTVTSLSTASGSPILASWVMTSIGAFYASSDKLYWFSTDNSTLSELTIPTGWTSTDVANAVFVETISNEIFLYTTGTSSDLYLWDGAQFSISITGLALGDKVVKIQLYQNSTLVGSVQGVYLYNNDNTLTQFTGTDTGNDLNFSSFSESSTQLLVGSDSIRGIYSLDIATTSMTKVFDTATTGWKSSFISTHYGTFITNENNTAWFDEFIGEFITVGKNINYLYEANNAVYGIGKVVGLLAKFILSAKSFVYLEQEKSTQLLVGDLNYFASDKANTDSDSVARIYDSESHVVLEFKANQIVASPTVGVLVSSTYDYLAYVSVGRMTHGELTQYTHEYLSHFTHWNIILNQLEAA